MRAGSPVSWKSARATSAGFARNLSGGSPRVSKTSRSDVCSGSATS
jgi:hypothetical protein